MSLFLGLNALQKKHAQRVVVVTRSYVVITLKRPEDFAMRAADIALATCLVESELKVYANSNVPGSLLLPHDDVGHDHQSVGMFQQQVPGWGSVSDCQSVDASTRKFLHRLFELDWHGRSNGELAQAVQVSAFPDRYAARDNQAIRIRKALW